MRRFPLRALGWLLLAALPAGAQPRAAGALPDTAGLPAIMREFRGVWIATVDNIDWPSKPGLTSAQQKKELLALLDRAQRLRLNAVIFQVRPSADALYASRLEPWSSFLTGRQGRPPKPYYDPLAFAVREAHARGLELHAWFNPYRVRHPADRSPAAPTHVSRSRPGLVRQYGQYLWFDPGDAAVRARTLRVVLDVVQRYDIDGVHIDDYFYPYPAGNLAFPDEATFQRYAAAGGMLTRDDWRRANVDSLVAALYAGIKGLKPWVKFGISPFGIWRPGFPASVRGFDAYTMLYADARKWLNEGWADYFTPQLYWRSDAPEQRYADLLGWWIGENRLGRHLWPGNYTSRATSAARSVWPAEEIVTQVRVTRREPGASGNVHFSMKAFGLSDELSARLTSDVYDVPALVPASPWLADSVPPAPRALARRSQGTWEVRLTPAPNSSVWLWTVRWKSGDAWQSRILLGSHRSLRLDRVSDADAQRGSAPTIVVTALDRAGLESEPVILGGPLLTATAAAGRGR
ncbi:MAG: glycoside hydrolase family 10 protein [Gemmatimonadaceae bacterium]